MKTSMHEQDDPFEQEHQQPPLPGEAPWSFLTDGGPDPATDPGEQGGEGGGNVYHVYYVREPKASQQQARAGGTAPLFPPEEEGPSAQPAQRWRVVLPLALACLLLVALIAGAGLAYWTQAPSASVTILPTQQTVTTHTSMQVVTTGGGSSTGAAPPAITGRMLASMTLSQAMTVTTSGTTHQDAQPARGRLTFYNGLPIVQTISAGTVLTTSLGAQIVTDEDAVIPAAVLPTSGTVTVAAHALTVGPIGNLPAYALSAPCCRENVYVQNSSPLTGGQLARTFRSVARQDTTSATALLATSLHQSVQAAMQPQVSSGETLITPLPCQEKVSSNHGVGDEAAQVTVTLQETCQGVVYREQAMQEQMRRLLNQQASAQLGPSYTVTGAVHTTVLHTQVQQGGVRLQVQATGQYSYQFSEAQLQHLKRLMAGRSTSEATALLLAQPGVRTISLSVGRRERDHLPTDVTQIALLVITPAA